MGKTYRTEGIVIKRFNFSEADKIITLFSKHYGKISCLAKGIRRPASRKGGNLELFNLSKVFLVKGKSIDIVTEAEVINSFAGFRHDLNRVALAFQASQLIDYFFKDQQKDWRSYQLFQTTLSWLSKEKVNLDQLMVNFKKKLLDYSGFGLPDKTNEPFLDSYIEKIVEKRLKYYYG